MSIQSTILLTLGLLLLPSLVTACLFGLSRPTAPLDHDRNTQRVRSYRTESAAASGNGVELGWDPVSRQTEGGCDSDVRSYDGTCTNDAMQNAGAAGQPHFSYFRKLSSATPSGKRLPSARLVSNVVCTQLGDVRNSRKVSEFATFFAQFLDHTIVATSKVATDRMDIVIPPDDSAFANKSGFLTFMRNTRAVVQSFPTNSRRRPPSGARLERPINLASSALDLSAVYGGGGSRLDAMREMKDGLMKTSGKGLLPRNTAGLFNSPSNAPNFFLAGDARANENPVLLSIHTLFVREHNTLAKELKRIFPDWDDEMLFQQARKINIAQFQKIVFEEFYPLMTGQQPKKFRKFRKNVDPSVSITFSTAAFRVGHTMISNSVSRRGRRNRKMPDIPLVSTFFDVQFVSTDGIDPFIRGAIRARAQEVDTLVVDGLRNFLFDDIPHEIGFDLVAMNIQRSRDHALPSYVQLARKFARKRIRSFSDITSKVSVQSKLATAYGHVSRIDPWVGLVAEDHVKGASIGPTMLGIWKKEFTRFSHGDRFFYLVKNLFSADMFKQVPRLREMYAEKNTMAQIILRNTGISKREIRSVWQT